MYKLFDLKIDDGDYLYYKYLFDYVKFIKKKKT